MVRFSSFCYDHGKDSVLLVPGHSSVISSHLRNPMNLDPFKDAGSKKTWFKALSVVLTSVKWARLTVNL